MFDFKKKTDPIELRKEELFELWSLECDEAQKRAYIDEYVALDTHQLEHEKIRAEHAIDGKTILSSAVTIGLAILTLNFERFDVLRSKVTNLWLRRRG